MGGKTIEAEFDATFNRVFEAAKLAVAQLGYSVIQADKSSGTISFNTGRSFDSWAGQDLTATLMSLSSGMKVIVGGSIAKGGNPLGGGSQLFAWGEKEKLSKRFLSKLGEVLPQVVDIEPITSTKTCPDCAEEVKEAAAKCRFCGHLFE
jgi:hypothetical protein